MQLTEEILAKFVGGQLEFFLEGLYIYRGEIKTICVKNYELQVTFTWLARIRKDFSTGWELDSSNRDDAIINMYTVGNIGPGKSGGDDRICFNAPIGDKVATLYPPNGSRLNPAKVEGLILS